MTQAQKLVESEHLAKQRPQTRSRIITAVGLVALLAAVVASFLGYTSYPNAAAVQRQAGISLAQQLAAQSGQVLDGFANGMPRAALQSIESLRRYSEESANSTFSAALTLLPHEVARMTHDDSVSAVAFGPDGKWVVSRSGSLDSPDNIVRVWRWQPEDLIDLACARLTRNLTQEEWKQYLGDGPYRKTCEDLP